MNGPWKDPYKPDTTSFNDFGCDHDTLVFCSPNYSNCKRLAWYITQKTKDEVTFTQDGKYESLYADKALHLILGSSCANPAYNTQEYSDSEIGGWSYNAATKKLTLVYDYTDGEDDYEAVDINVIELSSTKVIFENPDGDQFEYVKK